jgi:hypothetical protein
MGLADVTPLNAVKMKVAKMDNAFDKIQFKYLIANLIYNAKRGRDAKSRYVLYQQCVLS